MKGIVRAPRLRDQGHWSSGFLRVRPPGIETIRYVPVSRGVPAIRPAGPNQSILVAPGDVLALLLRLRSPRDSAFHLSTRRPGPNISFGNYPTPVLIKGRLVACDSKESTSLIEYRDAADFTLGCLPPSSTTALREVLTLGQPAGDFGQDGDGFGQVEPSEVYSGGDPTGLVTHVVWTSWGGSEGTGTGIGDWVGPSQIVADRPHESATIVAFDWGTCGGQFMFQAVEWHFPPTRPDLRSEPLPEHLHRDVRPRPVDPRQA